MSGMSNGLWVIFGPGLPCGARVSEDASSFLGLARKGSRWLDVSYYGNHLPQMYPTDQIRELTAEDCPALGLCPDCLGFGQLRSPVVSSVRDMARALDFVESPCPNCGGTGRPSLRISMSRTSTGVSGEIFQLVHEYVPPLPDGTVSAALGRPGESDAMLRAAFGVAEDMCLACAMSRDAISRNGKPLHVTEEEFSGS